MPGDLPNGIAMLPNDIIAILSDQATKRAFSTSAQWVNFSTNFDSSGSTNLKFFFILICLGCL